MSKYLSAIMKAETSSHSQTRHSLRFEENLIKIGNSYLEGLIAGYLSLSFEETLKSLLAFTLKRL